MELDACNMHSPMWLKIFFAYFMHHAWIHVLYAWIIPISLKHTCSVHVLFLYAWTNHDSSMAIVFHACYMQKSSPHAWNMLKNACFRCYVLSRVSIVNGISDLSNLFYLWFYGLLLIRWAWKGFQSNMCCTKDQSNWWNNCRRGRPLKVVQCCPESPMLGDKHKKKSHLSSALYMTMTSHPM